jgi:hypothetical protein
LPVNAAKLAFALDEGLVSLAREVWRLNAVTVEWKNGPISRKDIDFPRILHIRATMSKSLISTIIRNELRTTRQPPRHTSLRLPKRVMRSSNENPIIYALAHCDYPEVTPTKLEYLACLQTMKAYARWYDSDKDPNWVAADKLGRSIDFAKRLKPYRDWLDLNEVAWTLDEDGNKIPHARRYRKNHAQKQKIMKFAEELEIRLKRIPQSQQNKPVLWSPCYIRWTCTPELRRATH